MLTVEDRNRFSAKIRDAYKARLRELLECDLAGTKTWALLSGPTKQLVEECAVREELAELMRTCIKAFGGSWVQSLLQLPLQGAAGLYSGYGIPSAGPWKKLQMFLSTTGAEGISGNVPEGRRGTPDLYEDSLLPWRFTA